MIEVFDEYVRASVRRGLRLYWAQEEGYKTFGQLPKKDIRGLCVGASVQKASFLSLPAMRSVLLLALCLLGLVVCVLGYSVIPMNKKSNLTLYDRHDQYKRGNAPLGGGAGRVGYYFVELQIGGQQFRVDIVRVDAHDLELPKAKQWCH
jgi:hypothetical protein